MFYLQTNSSQFCNIESKTQKKEFNHCHYYIFNKKNDDQVQEIQKKYVHDDINRNIKEREKKEKKT